MNNQQLLSKIAQVEKEIVEKKQELTELKKSIPQQKVDNYHFLDSTNKNVSLLDLFADKEELIVIQNMGKSCTYCTMWADGFNGIYHHLIDKAAFVVASPDKPEVQDAFASERRWQFPMISTHGTNFKEAFGFEKDGHFHPGVTTFTKDDNDQIYFVADAPFGPGDDFCSVWPLFDLLPSGSHGFHPNRKINKKSDFQLTNNIAIQVTRYPEAVNFYTNILGMTPVDIKEKETKFQIGGQHFYIENSDNQSVFFEFAVKDLDRSKRLLLEHGCEITNKYNEKSMMISDPFGLRFHLFESV
ncbi:Predicted dithiol-disulfide oxidoreductase, DUF899 family [Oceanobacillus limi]|uniref:Predicted dithiol-disulfide oxidoreductase, DUF899 family n=1 Tax=Oceanobacillus limi TaxID=930131 RepID=A0A1I0AXD9_9BACI|nr:DUF899 family protein [Oceanobacillus limi]SES99060.1 Predicted dithiol-disulfide oxidoreductase, DUF899 family [Oceanobacillus limi]